MVGPVPLAGTALVEKDFGPGSQRPQKFSRLAKNSSSISAPRNVPEGDTTNLPLDRAVARSFDIVLTSEVRAYSTNFLKKEKCKVESE